MVMRSYTLSSCRGGGEAFSPSAIHSPREEAAFVPVYTVFMDIHTPFCCFLAKLGTWVSVVTQGFLSGNLILPGPP